MLVKLSVSAKVKGEWKSPNALIDLDENEARDLIRNKQAIDPKLLDIGKKRANVTDEMIEELISVEGVDDKLVGDLIDAGFDSVDKLSDAAEADLVAIKGIGQKTAEKIIASAIDLFNAKQDE